MATTITFSDLRVWSDRRTDDGDRLASVAFRRLCLAHHGLTNNPEFDGVTVYYDDQRQRPVVSATHEPTNGEIRVAVGPHSTHLGVLGPRGPKTDDIGHDEPYHQVPDRSHELLTAAA